MAMDDVTAISQLMLRERRGRMRNDSERLRDFHPDATVHRQLDHRQCRQLCRRSAEPLGDQPGPYPQPRRSARRPALRGQDDCRAAVNQRHAGPAAFPPMAGLHLRLEGPPSETTATAPIGPRLSVPSTTRRSPG